MTMKNIALCATLALASITAGNASAQSSQDPGWRAHLGAASIQATTGGSPELNPGAAVGLEYRASRRLGFELGVMSADIENDLDFGFFDFVSITIESKLRATPILAQLDVHLTPDHRVDLFIGPVVGYVLYGDREIRVRGLPEEEESLAVLRTSTDDGIAWGAHLGLNAQLGHSRAFFTARASYLKAEVESSAGDDELGALSFDLDPLAVQVGVGYRF